MKVQNHDIIETLINEIIKNILHEKAKHKKLTFFKYINKVLAILQFHDLMFYKLTVTCLTRYH